MDDSSIMEFQHRSLAVVSPLERTRNGHLWSLWLELLAGTRTTRSGRLNCRA